MLRAEDELDNIDHVIEKRSSAMLSEQRTCRLACSIMYSRSENRKM